MIDFSKRAKKAIFGIYRNYESSIHSCQYRFASKRKMKTESQQLNKKMGDYLSLCTNDGFTKEFIRRGA